MTVCAETASGTLSSVGFFTRSPLDRYASDAPRSVVPADAAVRGSSLAVLPASRIHPGTEAILPGPLLVPNREQDG
jgi:hypothetical protein